MGKSLLPGGLFCLLVLSASADDKEAKPVEVTGTLRTGVVAVGGETTGAVVESKAGTFELDFGQDRDLRRRADRLNGKAVTVAGTLEVRTGVEVKQRKVITVVRLREAGAKD